MAGGWLDTGLAEDSGVGGEPSDWLPVLTRNLSRFLKPWDVRGDARDCCCSRGWAPSKEGRLSLRAPPELKAMCLVSKGDSEGLVPFRNAAWPCAGNTHQSLESWCFSEPTQAFRFGPQNWCLEKP